MSKIIKVRATWEFEFDAEGYDSRFVDIPGLAKDSAKSELHTLLENLEITADDFKYTVADGTKYGELIQLPPEEFAKWICCPDMFDDNFKKPDCDTSDCTKCCLKYLLSVTDSETEKQPPEVANEESNPEELLICEEKCLHKNIPDELRLGGTEEKLKKWTRCSFCLRKDLCSVLTKLEKHIYDNYLTAVKIDQTPISMLIDCDGFCAERGFAFGYSALRKLFNPAKGTNGFCDSCDFENRCLQKENIFDSATNKFLKDILTIDNGLKIYLSPSCKGYSRKESESTTNNIFEHAKPTSINLLTWLKKKGDKQHEKTKG